MQPASADTPAFTRPASAPRRRRALLSDALRRPGGTRATSILVVVLIVAGVGMLAFPVVTDQLARLRQGSLRSQFDDPGVADSYRSHTFKVGESFTRLVIKKIGVDVVVVEGTTPAALKAGAGHYVGTPLPGEVGNVGIAGHRTTYGRPFNRLDQLKPGDTAVLYTPFFAYTYKAVPAFDGHSNPWVVDPDDFQVVAQDKSRRELTLTTCHPKGSAKHRLVMRFVLAGKTPVPTKGGAPK